MDYIEMDPDFATDGHMPDSNIPMGDGTLRHHPSRGDDVYESVCGSVSFIENVMHPRRMGADKKEIHSKEEKRKVEETDDDKKNVIPDNIELLYILVGSIAFLVALTWKDACEKIFHDLFGRAPSVVYYILYAVVITIVSYWIIKHFNRDTHESSRDLVRGWIL